MIVVVGAGAAGLVAAIFAARGGQPVTVIERTADGGRKILISGGGRCNILPEVLSPERFVTDSPPHLLRGMLRSWPLAQQRTFFEGDLQVPLAFEQESGKWFPASQRARDVRDALVRHAQHCGVRFLWQTSVTALFPNTSRPGVPDARSARVGLGWAVLTTVGPLTADAVVLASGGLSVPTTGSDGGGLAWTAEMGHRVSATYPALTPLVAHGGRDASVPPRLAEAASPHSSLSGVSLDVRLRARSADAQAEDSGGFLFTHRGYSGPAVLNVSHIAVRDRAATLRVRWTAHDERTWNQLLTTHGGLVTTLLGEHLPSRLALQLVAECSVPRDRRVAELRRDERRLLREALSSYALPWTGDEGYRKAEVTGGGVALDEIDPRTLESRRQRGLFLCGELLDAFGPIGGHNFAWAWATGRLAGIGASREAPSA